MIATLALVQDTFREALARKIFWGLFGLSTLMILFFLFLLKIDIVEGALATVSLFGRTTSRTQSVDELVIGAYAGIAVFLYTWGMFLAVLASAGLIPAVLEPGRIGLLLSKPISRIHILLGRYLGNILVIGSNVTYLVLGVWIILGIKTNIWRASFLASIASTMFIFAVLLAVVVLMGVLFESAALATMVSVGLMIMSPILAQTTTVMKLLSSEWSRQLWRGLYYVFPKIFDLGQMTLGLIRNGHYDSWMPVWSSALFGIIILSLAIGFFQRRDF
ncbi:MAG TPA: ABC transporter permease subunit [Bryobacteraceae bacterium]|nr:ABC transporter permease subunit [Bryobacteraceae bacterium]